MFGTISDFFTTVEASIIGLKRYVSATVCAEIIYYYTYIIYGLCMRVAKLAQSVWKNGASYSLLLASTTISQ